MPYDTILEKKIEDITLSWDGLEKKKMFGGICYLINGNMRFGGYTTRRPNESERLRKKMIGKPYSGKPNVRFDEGKLEIEPFGHYASSLLYCTQSEIIYILSMLDLLITNTYLHMSWSAKITEFDSKASMRPESILSF